MNKIKEIIRLRFGLGYSYDRIVSICQVGKGTVINYVEKAEQHGICWPLPEDLSEEALTALLCGKTIGQFVEPDYVLLHDELSRKGVTLTLLWQEYCQNYGERAYKYGRFCKGYRAWSDQQKVTMRFDHKAGEKLYVDYAGQTVVIRDPHTGEERNLQVFVACLGASHYVFAEATESQTLPDWIGSHVRAFAYLGGVPEMVVPDNLKSAVTKARRYDPDLNPSYTEMAAHYGVAIMPARPSKPRDKAKVEVGVQVVEREILAKLRHRTFFSKEEVNAAIKPLLAELNSRPFSKRPSSRKEQFEQVDKPALKPLPAMPYCFAEWKKQKLSYDYHICVEGCYYSAPYHLVNKRCDIRITKHSVEIFYRGSRVAAHAKLQQPGARATIEDHKPLQHQHYREWTPASLGAWAHTAGPSIEACMQTYVFTEKAQIRGLRHGVKLFQLVKEYGPSRVEAACSKALTLQTTSITSIRSLLEKKLEQTPCLLEAPVHSLPSHGNIRGAAYFQQPPKKEGTWEPSFQHQIQKSDAVH